LRATFRSICVVNRLMSPTPLSYWQTLVRVVRRLGAPALAAWVLASSANAAAEAPDFDRDIRPILSDRCFKCHGPDAERREAELRLDTRDGLLDYVVVPGRPEESELIARITSADESVRMPPPESKLSLSVAEKERLKAWVAGGAKVTEHWAFRPLPEVVAVPDMDGAAWPRNSIDNFVLARLEAENLPPSPEAQSWRLLRRVALDLTGLPPTVEEIQEFEAQARVDVQTALEIAVDRLLASAAYGEHMAVAWLDAARYADSYGYQSDQLNTQWPYRDWVVRAFNENLPYDEFVTQQLAGDLMPGAGHNEKLATAFNRLHRLTNEGGSLAEEWLAENAADRVHTMGTAMLGLTLECARCHDHKYDPITQRDYYSLAAFFNSIDESGMYDHASKTPAPSLLLPTAKQEAELEAACRAADDAEAALAAAIADGEQRFSAWLATSAQWSNDVDLLRHVNFDGIPVDEASSFESVAAGGTDEAGSFAYVDGARGRAIAFDGDRGAEFSGLIHIERWQPFTIDFWLRDAAHNRLPTVVMQQTRGTDVGYNGFDLMLADGVMEARLYRVWPGNAIGVRATKPIAQNQWEHLTVTYDGSSRARGLRLYLNGVELPTDVVRDRIHKSVSVAAHGQGHFTLGARFRDRGFKDGAIDELRVFARAIAPIEVASLHEAEAGAPDAEGLEAALREYFFSAVDSESRQFTVKLQEARRRLVEAEDPILEVSVMEELLEPRPTFVLARGAYDAPKSDANRVERDTFHDMLWPFPPGAPRNRLGLAQWMTDPRHALTARVFVNRLWANYFGQGLVATPENFGRQGAAPTHPALLDWMARDFVDSGWDVKRLCRQIVLSATYRQDSRLRPELRARDPDNGLLARGPSRRLSAEQTRDVALAASGLLDRTVGGPPVSPYQPGEDLWREANSMSPPYRQSTGKGLYRRSIYSVWKRTAPLPNMMAFDAGAREVCTVSRGRTNTPLQALVLLNDVQFVEACRALAAKVAQRHQGDVAGQVQEAFLRLAGRAPDDGELGLLVEAYHEQRELFAEDGEQAAGKFLSIGESRTESSLRPEESAALTAVCQIILNLDATIYLR
jgi:hypothetical protein